MRVPLKTRLILLGGADRLRLLVAGFLGSGRQGSFCRRQPKALWRKSPIGCHLGCTRHALCHRLVPLVMETASWAGKAVQGERGVARSRRSDSSQRSPIVSDDGAAVWFLLSWKLADGLWQDRRGAQHHTPTPLGRHVCVDCVEFYTRLYLRPHRILINTWCFEMLWKPTRDPRKNFHKFLK